MTDEAAGFGQKRTDPFFAGLPEKLQKLRYGNGTAACRRHGAFTADDVESVDHFSVIMGRNGNAAADMTDNIPAILILPALGDTVANGGFLQIEGVQVYMTVNVLDPGETGAEGQLVRIGRIYHKAGFPVWLRQRIGNEGTQLSRMLHAIRAPAGVIQQQSVHGVGSAFYAEQPSAPADKGICGTEIDPGLFQSVQNHFRAVR